MMMWLVLLVSAAVAPGCPDGMLGVPGGSFEIAGETVAVAAFCLDRTEVTVASYALCVEAGACSPAHDTVRVPNISERDRALWSRSCNAQDPGRTAYPINCVDQAQARAFCTWRHARLPRSAAWTWAARGGDAARTYPWGSTPASERRVNACGAECRERLVRLGVPWRLMYYGDDHYPTTAPVGSFQHGAGRFGHLDLAGNVWERVEGTLEKQPGSGIIRGGGWLQTDAKWLETNARAAYPPDARGSAVGFRCAADPRGD